MAEQFDPYHKWLGIRPEERPVSYYRLLGILPFEDDQDSIANAADQRMAHVRSFQAGKHGALSQQLLNEISTAKVCLLNSDKKAAYDEQLRKTSSLPVAKAEPLEVVAVEPPAFRERPSEAFDFSAQIPFHKKPKADHSKQNLQLLAVVAAFVVVLVGALIWLTMRRQDSKEPDGDVVAQSIVAPTSDVKVPLPLPSQAMPAASTTTQVPKTKLPKSVPPKPNETTIEPKAMPQAEPQTQKPPPEATQSTATDKSHDDQGRNLSQAKEQFGRELAAAASPEDYRDVAKRGMALAKRAFAENDSVIANTAAKESLTAARKSADSELVKEATLLLIQMQAVPAIRP